MTTNDGEYTCPDCGETIDVSVCHCGDGPNDSAHRGEDSHHFTPYNRCRCAVIREGIFEGVRAALSTARAEAALAEREACAREIGARAQSYSGGAGHRATLLAGFVVRELESLRDATRARTTPATLSTETLAAIAEARGLRVVEPGLLAGIDAKLATAERERDEARAELASMRADLAALTGRVEAEIAAAAEAVRARTIEECVALVTSEADRYGKLADETEDAVFDECAFVLSTAATSLRALAAPQPAPAEPADVDPAAGALR